MADDNATASQLQALDTDLQNLIKAVNRGNEILSEIATILGATVTPPAVTGSRGGNVALANLLTALAASNLIVDGTTP